jgi:hypothetical protein
LTPSLQLTIFNKYANISEHRGHKIVMPYSHADINAG